MPWVGDLQFGTSAVAAFQGPTITGLRADGHLAVAATGLLPTMSPQSQLLQLIDTTVFSSEIGKELSKMAQGALLSLADSVGEVATGVLGNIAGAIPFIGTAVSMIASVWQSEQAAAAQSAAENKVACANLYNAMAPQASSGSGVVPADIFAPYFGVSGYYTNPAHDVDWNHAGVTNEHGFVGSYGQPSAIGRQLMAITEGGYTLSAPSKTSPLGWYFDVEGYSALVLAARKDLKQPKLGVPTPKRMLFAKLRIAMQVAWRPPAGSPLLALGRLPNTPLSYPAINVSDGGSSLFPAYMDLLVKEYEAGHITPEFFRYLDSHMVMKDGSVVALGGGTEKIGCSDGTWKFLMRWLATVRPAYTQDVASLAKLRGQVESMLPPKPGGGVPVVFLSALAAGAYAVYNPAVAMMLLRRGGALGAKLVSKVRGWV